jgi:folate-binding protein YgfZ
MTAELANSYQAATTGVGLFEFGARTQLELTGDDRASFLHNLCTNDIQRLSPGSGCEALVTNAQGKVLGHVYVFCGAHSLVLETVPGAAASLMAHFERYHIREKVEIHDRSGEWAEWLLCGAGAPELFRRRGIEMPRSRLAHGPAQVDSIAVWLRRMELTAVGDVAIACRRQDSEPLAQALQAAGATPCPAEVFEILRIEAGTPLYGVDISDRNLPQEVARDAAAISFTKGCYLGQETVARIDALGHVNRTLCGVRLLGTEVPPPGSELFALDEADKPVGVVTSAALSPKLGAPLALAYVRRGYNRPGVRLRAACGQAEVVALPV